MTPGPDTIDAVWDVLNDALVALYGEVLRGSPTVRWAVNARANPAHHLMADAEFDRVGRPDEEDLVISISVARWNDRVVWTADAGQSGGVVLDDGVRRDAPAEVPLSTWIGEALEDTITWLRAATPHFIAYLNQEPTPYDVP